jgi:hypothetical protein
MFTSVPPEIDGLTDISARNGPTAISVCANSSVPTTTPATPTSATVAATRTRRGHGLRSTCRTYRAIVVGRERISRSPAPAGGP